MKHYGDVSKINGAEVEPVDIISFGSPCQDLSVAGKRAGIQDGERSNLFFEAIRIIKEMREATNDEYPKYAVWENVPGAFSSNKGHDFHAVLEAFCSVCDGAVSIPKPYDAKQTDKLVWNKAGEIVGNNYSIAWRTLDAQYWGVPQRRKRIYLVADFTGRRAGEILFKPEGRIRDSSEGRKTRKSFTINAMGGTDGTNRNGGMIYGQEEATNAREILSEVRGAIGAESLEEWLRGTITFFQRAEILQFEMCQSEDREKPNNSGELPSNGKRYIPGNDVLCGLRATDKDGCSSHRQEPIEQLTEQFGEIVQKLSLKTTQEQSSLLDLWKTSESKRFLPTSLFRISESFENREAFSRRYGKSVAVTADAVGSVDGSVGVFNESGIGYWMPGCGCLRAEGENRPSRPSHCVIALQANGIDRAYGIDHVITTGGNCTAQGSCVYEDTQATLKAGGVHAVCFDRATFNQGINAQYDFEVSEEGVVSTVVAKGPSGVCYDTRGNGDSAKQYLFENHSQDTRYKGPLDVSPIVSATFGMGGNNQPFVIQEEEPPRKYIIRRLTPTECARLQGFPDWWSELAPYNPDDAEFWEEVRKTDLEIRGKKYKPVKDIKKWYDKLHTDSAEYKAYGNGLALPCAEFVIRGTAEHGAKTLGSLFDGIGGFPLAGVLNGIKPIWASEVEPYPIAVTKSRFKDV